MFCWILPFESECFIGVVLFFCFVFCFVSGLVSACFFLLVCE